MNFLKLGTLLTLTLESSDSKLNRIRRDQTVIENSESDCESGILDDES